MSFDIYLVTSTVSGKRYVGATSQGIPRRWRQHARDSLSADSKRHFHALHKAIAKHGPDSFTVEHYASAVDRPSLMALEIAVIADLRTTCSCIGYNMTPGGDGGPRMTPEAAKKVGDAHRGRKHTPEQIASRAAAISAAKKGKAPPREVQEKAWAANRGSVHSAERREVTAASLRGVPKSAAHVANMAAALRGRKLSPEHCAAMRAASTGRAHSPEARAKISAAAIARHALRKAEMQLAA